MERPRPAAAPPIGLVEPFDAGWDAHELGISRRTVEVLAADPGWALLGWDTRALAVALDLNHDSASDFTLQGLPSDDRAVR